MSKNNLLAALLIVFQLIVAAALIALGFYAEENFYAPINVDGYFYIRFLVPGTCLVIGAFFDMLSYGHFERKVYMAAYCFLLVFAMANTLSLAVYALNHFPITWVSDILGCILVSALTAVVCALFSFGFVLAKGRAGKVRLSLEEEKED